MEWLIGQKVWYTPSEGAQFAGVVLSHVGMDGCCQVLMTANYSVWKGNSHRIRTCPAIPAYALTPRQDDRVMAVDSYFTKTRLTKKKKRKMRKREEQCK